MPEKVCLPSNICTFFWVSNIVVNLNTFWKLYWGACKVYMLQLLKCWLLSFTLGCFISWCKLPFLMLFWLWMHKTVNWQLKHNTTKTQYLHHWRKYTLWWGLWCCVSCCVFIHVDFLKVPLTTWLDFCYDMRLERIAFPNHVQSIEYEFSHKATK